MNVKNLLKKKTVYIPMILCFVFFVFLFLKRGKTNLNEKSFAVVKTQKVKQTNLSKKLTLTGELEPIQWLDIKSKIPGRIICSDISENIFIKKDQILAQVDIEQWKIKLKKAQASLDMAKSAMEIAYLQLEDKQRDKLRMEHLFEENAVPEKQKEMTELECQRAFHLHKQSIASLQAVKSTLEEVEDTFQEASIKAPFDGVIAKKYFQNYDLIVPNCPLFRLMKIDTLILKIKVPERFAFKLQQNMQATLSVDAKKGSIFTCKVYKIYPSIDPITRSVEVELLVENKDRALMPGLFAKVNLELEKIENTLAISENSIISRRYVYVVKDDKVNLRQIKRGIQDHDLVEIVEGLKEGEEVVTIGQHKLSENMQIQKYSEDKAQ